MDTLYVIAAYIAIGAIVSVTTKEGPEDDGWLWVVVFWPVFLLLTLLEWWSTTGGK